MASNFFRSLRRATRNANAADVPGLETALRNSSNFDTSLNRMLMNGTFDVNPATRKLRLNGALDMNVGETLLRRGNLREFATLSKSLDPGNAAQAGFRQSISGTVPDIKIRQLDDATTSARIAHADLDVVPTDTDTSATFMQRLTPEAGIKLENAMRKIRSLAGTTAVVGGVVVGFIIGVDLLQNLIDETRNRRGCFRIRPTGRRDDIVSCRLLTRTCHEPRDDRPCVGGDNFPFPEPPGFFPTNVRLVLEQALTDPLMQVQIRNSLDIEIFDRAAIDKIMNSADLFDKMSKLHLDANMRVIDPCMNIPGTNTDLCRACSTALNANDVGFADLSELSDPSISLICIRSSSILDTIVDIGIGNGVDLLSPFGRISDSGSGAFIMYTLIIVLLIIVAAIVFTLVRKKN